MLSPPPAEAVRPVQRERHFGPGRVYLKHRRAAVEQGVGRPTAGAVVVPGAQAVPVEDEDRAAVRADVDQAICADDSIRPKVDFVFPPQGPHCSSADAAPHVPKITARLRPNRGRKPAFQQSILLGLSLLEIK